MSGALALRADNAAERTTVLELEDAEIIRSVHDGAGVDEVVEVVTAAASEIRSERAAFAVEFMKLPGALPG